MERKAEAQVLYDDGDHKFIRIGMGQGSSKGEKAAAGARAIAGLLDERS